MRFLLMLLMPGVAPPVDVKPLFATEAVGTDPDDPAIWVNRKNPAKSWILGTDKTAAPNGSLTVFDLKGKKQQVSGNLDRPNNVDVEYDLGGHDIAVVTERYKNQLRIYKVDKKGLEEWGQVSVFEAPMGIALYKRPRDEAVFAIVGRKKGPQTGYLWQYRLEVEGGRIKATKVREFGNFSGSKEIEAIAVDDARGHVYYADEDFGIRKWHADPEHPKANKEIAVFGREGFKGNREGIAIVAGKKGEGYIVCTDQIAGNSEYRMYRRYGKQKLVRVVRGGADSTDGLEINNELGLMVAMNSSSHNFLVFDLRQVTGR
ncbi:MAG: phytase [Bryobacteraceae bacterium]